MQWKKKYYYKIENREKKVSERKDKKDYLIQIYIKWHLKVNKIKSIK